MIIEYDSKYDEEIKDLLVQLQQYLADMDIEGYNIVGEGYRDKYYDFKAPKRGRITELVVDKEYRGKGIGKELLLKMKEHLKSNGCEKIMIAVFGYNESAIKFYKENGFHIRVLDMIED